MIQNSLMVKIRDKISPHEKYFNIIFYLGHYKQVVKTFSGFKNLPDSNQLDGKSFKIPKVIDMIK